jgi:uncharacterized FlaG/YvyC family protein
MGQAGQTGQTDQTGRAGQDGPAAAARPEDAGAGQVGQADQAGQAAQDQARAARDPEIDRAARTFQDYLNSAPSEMNFSYDVEAGRSIFRPVNPVTGEVLRQFPPDEFLARVNRLRDVSDAFAEGGALMDVRT